MQSNIDQKDVLILFFNKLYIFYDVTMMCNNPENVLGGVALTLKAESIFVTVFQKMLTTSFDQVIR